jgi:hypothetical protein
MNLYDRKKYLDENANACSYIGGESVFAVVKPHFGEVVKTAQNRNNGIFSVGQESAKTIKKSGLVSKNTEKTLSEDK